MDSATLVCRVCEAPNPGFPVYAAPASYCESCWKRKLEDVRQEIEPVRVTRRHKSALAQEHVLLREEIPVGRLILFRDGMSICVRYLTGDPEGEVALLDQTLRRLLGSWSRDYLDVEIIRAELNSTCDHSVSHSLTPSSLTSEEPAA